MSGCNATCSQNNKDKKVVLYPVRPQEAYRRGVAAFVIGGVGGGGYPHVLARGWALVDGQTENITYCVLRARAVKYFLRLILRNDIEQVPFRNF